MLIAISAIAKTKWRPTVIITFDGERIECLTEEGVYPSSVMTYKLSETSEKKDLKTSNVKYVEYLLPNDMINLWIHTTVYVVNKKGGIEPYIPTSSLSWLQALKDPRYNNQYVVVYYDGRYGVYRNTDDFAIVCVPGFFGYAKEKPAVKTIFGDCPDLLEYIDLPEVKLKTKEDLQKIVDEYNNCK